MEVHSNLKPANSSNLSLVEVDLDTQADSDVDLDTQVDSDVVEQLFEFNTSNPIITNASGVVVNTLMVNKVGANVAKVGSKGFEKGQSSGVSKGKATVVDPPSICILAPIVAL